MPLPEPDTPTPIDPVGDPPIDGDAGNPDDPGQIARSVRGAR